MPPPATPPCTSTPRRPPYGFLLSDNEEETKASVVDINNEEERALLDSLSSCPESPPPLTTHFPYVLFTTPYQHDTPSPSYTPPSSHHHTPYTPYAPPPSHQHAPSTSYHNISHLKKTIQDILRKYNYERNAGRLAVQLAQFHFFETQIMKWSTAGTLDPHKMQTDKRCHFGKIPNKMLSGQRSPMGEVQEGYWP